MAGDSAFAAGFDAVAFRVAIRETMKMGAPPDPADQLTWRWKRLRTYLPEDQAHNPYDWTETAVTDAPGNPDETDGSLIVDYAVEFSARPAGSVDVAAGQFDTSRAVVTLLDEDYEQVKTADYATIGNTTYDIDFTGPPIGMFAVGVFTVYLTARDEA
jgi:hypothetical protein